MSIQGKKRTNSNLSEGSSPSLSPAHKVTNYRSVMADQHSNPPFAPGILEKETEFNQMVWAKLTEISDTMRDMKICHSILENRVDKISDISEKALKTSTVLEKKVVFLEHENAHLKDKVQNLETYSRKYNLLFINVPEDRNENATTLRRKLGNILSMVYVDLDSMYIDNIHRLPTSSPYGPKPIIIKFVSYLDRDLVWSKNKQLYESGNRVVIREHFPKEIENNIRQLLPIRKAAKSQGKMVKMIGDKMIIDKKQYTVNNLHTLPADLRPEAVATRKIEDHIFFFTGVSPLSNFHASEFEVNGVKYSRGEQFIQHRKALMFGEVETAEAIMAAKTPQEMKRLGDSFMKTFSESAWRSSAPEIMEQGLEEKFKQNKELKKFLLSTGATKLVEAAKNDSFWGIGKTMYDPNIMKSKASWGQNHLGQILTNIRDKFVYQGDTEEDTEESM
jgi:ribA/ribD-fused uncharacterized protein